MSELERMPSDSFIVTAIQNIRSRQDAFRYINCYSHTECHMSTGCLPKHSLLQPYRMSEFDSMPSDTFIATATQNIRIRQNAFRYIKCYSYADCQMSTGCLLIHSLLQPHRMSDVERCLPIHSLLQQHRMSEVDRMPSDKFIATATQNIRSRQDAFRYINCCSHTEYQKLTRCLPIH